MNWINILEQIFELAIFPIVTIASIYVCYLISVKINEIKKKTNNEMSKKYLDMLNDTITSAVLTTTQTYVEELKKNGIFDKEAQKAAFQKTYDAVMKMLTEEAKKYLVESVGDLETYVTNRIEAEVKITKTYA